MCEVLSNGEVRTEPLTEEELRAEWRAAQNEMISMQLELAHIADAVWPPGDSERPADLDEEGATGDVLVEGIRSLHELTDRLMCENEDLRERVTELEADQRGGMSALDMADVKAALQCQVGQLYAAASRVGVYRAHESAEAARTKARRLEQLLAAFFTVLLMVLSGCAETEPAPPPYLVFFADSVPEADRAVWGASASAWSAAVGEFVFLVGGEPARGRCGVEVVLVERWLDDSTPAWAEIGGDCLTTIYYARGQADACIAVHELGHQLGLGHVAGTVMDEWPCDFDAVVTPELARRVKSRWGMP